MIEILDALFELSTSTSIEALLPPAVTVILVEPYLLATTRPLLSTEAIEEFLDSQLAPTTLVYSLLESFAIQVKLYFSPISNSRLEGDIEIEWTYDIPSLLQYYSGIFSKPALEKLTGINQKQFFHYASGMVKPRPAQRKKISEALHKLGAELMTVKL